MGRPLLFHAWPQFDAPETDFWRDLQGALAARSLDLVLVSTTAPPRDLPIPHVPFVPTVDSLWAEPRRGGDLTSLGLDPQALLAREQDWSGPVRLDAITEFRRQALNDIAAYASEIVRTLQPAAAVIWNGHHVPETILAAALRQRGTPMLCVERAPVPRALFVDDEGLSSASAVARRLEWPPIDARWHRRADEVSARIARGSLTWWEQPDAYGSSSLRTRLGVPPGRQVLVFAGQVDADTQRFMFSPVFADNLEAWRWFLTQLAGRDEVFVIGKHHPKATTSPAAYAQVLAESGVAGAWCSDIAIDDALAVADRVAAVNSTVLYESLARGIPALTMGDWLLQGRGVAYEVRDRRLDGAQVEAWLTAADFSTRRDRWRAAMGFLLSGSIYAYEREEVRAGCLGASHLADRLASLCEPGAGAAVAPVTVPHRDPPPGWLSPGEEPAPGWPVDPLRYREWHEAHTLRHTLHRAALATEDGRRVVVWGPDEHVRAVRALAPRTVTLQEGALVRTSPRDFVLIATGSWQIPEELTARGFVPGVDVITVQCQVAAMLAGQLVPVGSR
jgi:hypothetical protein